jgi:hypothetical protein
MNQNGTDALESTSCDRRVVFYEKFPNEARSIQELNVVNRETDAILTTKHLRKRGTDGK